MVASAAAMAKVFEQGDPNTAVCCKTGVFFAGSWRNFAFVYSAMLLETWKFICYIQAAGRSSNRL